WAFQLSGQLLEFRDVGLFGARDPSLQYGKLHIEFHRKSIGRKPRLFDCPSEGSWLDGNVSHLASFPKSTCWCNANCRWLSHLKPPDVPLASALDDPCPVPNWASPWFGLKFSKILFTS